MKTQEQLKKEAKLDALKLLPFIRRPDVFIRSIQGGQYEAIRPGDWTSFESQPIKSATFQVLLEDGDIRPWTNEDMKMNRWIPTRQEEK